MMEVKLSKAVEKQGRAKVIIMVIIFILFNYLCYIRFYQPSRNTLLDSRERLVDLQERIAANDLKLAKASKHKGNQIISLKKDKLTEFVVKLNKLSFNFEKEFFNLEIGALKEDSLPINLHLQSDYTNFLSYLAALEEFEYLQLRAVEIKGDENYQDRLDIRMKLVINIAN
ncbi:hypothetical protein BX659_10298 [Orenia metallireducens]|uniref:Type IV pilus assembly protein PilO n=2 Tax=Orenia metallireducens TaxID=1413210 RepID=A0A285F2R9_9FIRM|nr:hypothetical protein BX659_10298 [Orenia metallireducens]SNY05610.1 hypothetical protein SAMN06265827_10198 [Orenia metallireducens]